MSYNSTLKPKTCFLETEPKVVSQKLDPNQGVYKQCCCTLILLPESTLNANLTTTNRFFTNYDWQRGRFENFESDNQYESNLESDVRFEIESRSFAGPYHEPAQLKAFSFQNYRYNGPYMWHYYLTPILPVVLHINNQLDAQTCLERGPVRISGNTLSSQQSSMAPYTADMVLFAISHHKASLILRHGLSQLASRKDYKPDSKP